MVWRRRTCPTCKAVFTTSEQAELRSAIMVKTPEHVRPLERDSLLIAVYESCKHRPDAHTTAASLTNTIIGALLEQTPQDGLIAQETVQRTVRTVLERFDPTAATIYTAYN